MSRESAKKGGKPSEAAVKRLIEQGDFYETLGVSPTASNREILDALRQRRREYRALDQEWNEMHTVLTQQRGLYDQARAERDRTLRGIERKFGKKVASRYPKHVIWPRIWGRHRQVGQIKREALRIVQDAEQWKHSEDAYQQTRAQLDREYGQVVFDLLNLDQLRGNLPDHPEALLHFAEETQKAARQVIEGLPTLEIMAEEVRSGEAKRTLTRKREDCRRCRGKGRITLRGMEVVEEAKQNAQLREQMLRQGFPVDLLLSYEPVGPLTKYIMLTLTEQTPDWLGDLHVKMPCPLCSSEVTFRLPSDVAQGQVVRGDQKDGGEKVHARVKSIIGKQIEFGASKPATPRFTFREKMVAAAALILTFFGHIPCLFGGQPVYTAQDNVLDPGLRGLALLGSIAILVWYVIIQRPVQSAVLPIFNESMAMGLLLTLLLYYATVY